MWELLCNHVFISLVSTSRRGIAESDDHYISFFEGIIFCFQSNCISYSSPAMSEHPNSPSTPQPLPFSLLCVHCGYWDSNWGPCTCPVSSLPDQPHAQPCSKVSHLSNPSYLQISGMRNVVCLPPGSWPLGALIREGKLCRHNCSLCVSLWEKMGLQVPYNEAKDWWCPSVLVPKCWPHRTNQYSKLWGMVRICDLTFSVLTGKSRPWTVW